MDHPYILCCGTEQQPLSFSIVVEGVIIHIGNSASDTFQNLFASFFAFQLPYPPLLKPFYRFFEESVFCVLKQSPTTLEFGVQLDAA